MNSVFVFCAQYQYRLLICHWVLTLTNFRFIAGKLAELFDFLYLIELCCVLDKLEYWKKDSFVSDIHRWVLWWMNFHPSVIIFICFYPVFLLLSRSPLLFNLFLPFSCQSTSLYLDGTLSSKSVFAGLRTLCGIFLQSFLHHIIACPAHIIVPLCLVPSTLCGSQRWALGSSLLLWSVRWKLIFDLPPPIFNFPARAQAWIARDIRQRVH